MRKIAVLLITLTFLVTTLFSMSFSSAAASHDYATALKYSILFYDANKCGPDAAVDNVFSWRGPCHTTDGSEIGLDLTGGYHDAGDHVKFGLLTYIISKGWYSMTRPSGLKGFATITMGQVASITGTAMTQFGLSYWVWQEFGRATPFSIMSILSLVHK